MIWWQLLVNGLLYGGLVAVAALGLALVFGVMRIVNFANGELVAIGAYVTWLIVLSGFSPLVGVPVAFLVGALLGALIDRFIVTPIAKRPELEMLMATYGLSVLMVGLLTQVFTGDIRSYSTGPSGNFSLLGVVVGWRSLTVLLICLGLVVATIAVVRFTRFGIGIRAMAQNRDAAASCGVNVNASRTLVLAFASGLAGSAGALVSLVSTISPSLGYDWLLNSFVVVVLGGMGSIAGTLIAALFIGVVRSFGSFVIDDSWTVILTYMILYAALLLRPHGLLGRTAAQ